jgi:hypothetical protein
VRSTVFTVARVSHAPRSMTVATLVATNDHSAVRAFVQMGSLTDKREAVRD